MLAKLFELKDAGGKGKGLFARKPIPKGTIISFECSKCRRIPKEDFEVIPTKEKSFIFKYGYKKVDGSYLLPCDEIIYLNHSCNANILASRKGFDIVVKDIAKGEEATYDYRSFFHDSDEFEFECMCGEYNCCRIVRSIYDHNHHHPQSIELLEFWKMRVDSALICIDKIDQQLLKNKLPTIESFM
ncbi:MAG: SET domain-containing protein-lysine N-methyltransferase [Thermoproteota archaeon]|nr:SET domain-containing protein-lysine N-methyltransferase [Thermoproteota archaeon]